MKKILFLLAILPTIFSCSSSEDAQEQKLSLSKNNLTIQYKGEDFLDINGVNSSECNISIEDDYFGRINVVGNTIKVQAEKVGKTNIFVRYNNQENTCKLEVTPIVNYIGIPIVGLGENMDYIKENEKNQFIDESASKLTYYDKNIPFGANHYYNFKGGELNYIVTYIEISKLSGGSSMSTFKEKVGASLDERYSFIQQYKGKYQDILIYTFKSNFFIGARLAGGNGGWYICYSKTLDQIKNILDVSSSMPIS